MILSLNVWFVWIWAYLYKPGEKFLQMEVTGAGSEEQKKRIEQLEEQVRGISTALNEYLASVSEDVAKENQNG